MAKKLKIDRSYWLYGLVMGMVLILLQIIEYRTRIRDLQIELYVILIGGLFLALGTWIGVKVLSKRTRSTPMDIEALNLSTREKEVLELLVEGYSNQEISDKLFVSLNTTKTHISNIYAKLGVRRRTQAVQKARTLVFEAHSKG